MKKFCIGICIALLSVTSVFAQASVVAEQKARLGITVNPTRGQLHELAKAVARATGGQLLVPTGDNCNGFSCDKICHSGRIIDYLRASEETAEPSWQDVGPVVAPLRCENVPGDPNPGGGGDPTTSVDAKIKALQDQINSIRESIIVIDTRIDALSKGGTLPPPEGATLTDLLNVNKQILELLQKTAARFGIK